MKKLLIAISLGAIMLPSFAASENTIPNKEFLPLPPRATVWGLSGQRLLGEADAMLPIYGNEDAVFYFDAQGKTGFSSDWLASVGTGVRRVINDQRIFGAYVFVDENLADNQPYWFITPGLESLGQDWDFRANAYIPVSTQRKYLSTDFADNFGNYNYVQFQQHTQYDAIVQEYQSTGWAVDGEIGRSIPQLPGLRVYLGGYHASPKEAQEINGVSARLEYPLTAHIGLSLRGSYDKVQHNSVLLGLNMTLGGINKTPRDLYASIQNRLLDPIERHLATQAQATGEPIVEQEEVLNYSAMEKANIWFFQPDGGSDFNGPGSCTAENPCSNFNQATIDGINEIAGPLPSFYFKPGQYASLTISPDQNAVPLQLTDDALFGRSADYRRPEQSAEFIGAMNFSGVDSLNYLKLYNSEQYTQNAAITLQSSSSLLLDRSIIGANNGSQSYVTGIEMTDSVLKVMDHSQINAFSGSTAPATGIAADGNLADITLNNSQINVDAATKNSVTALGINASAAARNTVQLNDSQINVSANLNDSFKSGNISATGIAVNGANNTLELSGNSRVEVMAAGNNIETGSSVGIAMNTGDVTGGQNIVILQGDSQINVNAQPDLGYYWNVNSFSATGIWAVTGVQGKNTISLLGNSKISSNINDAASGGIGDLFSVRGISAYGAADSSNFISLQNNSLIEANLDYEGKRSVSSHVCAVCSFASNNVITLSDHSSIDATSYISPNSLGHNEASADGILADGKTNTIDLGGKASVTVSSSVTGGNGNVIYVDGINARGTNTILLSDSSSVKAQSDLNDNDKNNFSFVSGIDANGNNTIMLQDQSSVFAIANVHNASGYNDVKIQGIDLDGTSWLSISKNSIISALGTADGRSPYVEVYGINSAWSKSQIYDEDKNMDNITAQAIAPGGEAVAKKINPYHWGDDSRHSGVE